MEDFAIIGRAMMPVGDVEERIYHGPQPSHQLPMMKGEAKPSRQDVRKAWRKSDSDRRKKAHGRDFTKGRRGLDEEMELRAF